MRPVTYFLRLVTLTAFPIPVLEVAAIAAQKPGFFEENRFLPEQESLSLEVATPQHLAQADSSQSEAARLFEQGLEQYNRCQFRAAIATWEQLLNLVRDTGNRQAEGTVLNALGAAYEGRSQYEQQHHRRIPH